MLSEEEFLLQLWPWALIQKPMLLGMRNKMEIPHNMAVRHMVAW